MRLGRKPWGAAVFLSLMGMAVSAETVETHGASRSAGADPRAVLFAKWVDLADRHREAWDGHAVDLTPELRTRAIRLANGLFGGPFGGYVTSWSGFERAAGEHFASRQRVRRSPPRIVEPARSYLLWRLAAYRAERIRRGIGFVATDDPLYWEAFANHVSHGNHFGFLKQRAAYVIPRMMAEATLGANFGEEGVLHAGGAYAALQSARWQLERARDRFGNDDDAGGMFFVTDAVRSLQLARGHGLSPGRVRLMLTERFGDRLASGEVVTRYQGDRLTLREALHNGIAYWRTRADRKTGVDLGPFANLLLDLPVESPSGAATELDESVVVTASAVNLNLEGYLLRELAVIVDDASGLNSLRGYAEMDVLGKLLFMTLLSDTARPKDYSGIREACREWLRQEHGIDATGDSLTRTMIVMGRAILTVPDVLDGLQRRQRGQRLLGRLALLDSPGHHTLVGNLWTGHALNLQPTTDPTDELARLSDRIDAFHAARTEYLEAHARFVAGSAPPVLRRLADAAEREALDDTERALQIAVRFNLDDEEALADFMGGTVGARARAERLSATLSDGQANRE